MDFNKPQGPKLEFTQPKPKKSQNQVKVDHRPPNTLVIYVAIAFPTLFVLMETFGLFVSKFPQYSTSHV